MRAVSPFEAPCLPFMTFARLSAPWLILSVSFSVHLQVYVNYKLKSVAHLPWRALCYKVGKCPVAHFLASTVHPDSRLATQAFTTFVDDVFAWIVELPLAHRCSSSLPLPACPGRAAAANTLDLL